MLNQIAKTVSYFIIYNLMSFAFLYIIRIIYETTENLVTQIFISSLIPGFIFLTYSLIREKNKPHRNQNYKYLSGFLLTFIVLSWSIINIERSRSFQVLRSVYINEITSQSELSELSILAPNQEERNKSAFLRRINEQINDGNVRCDEDKINLTNVGNFIQATSAEIAKYYNLEGFFEIDETDKRKPSTPTRIDCRYFE
jgi:hypothetical protein